MLKSANPSFIHPLGKQVSPIVLETMLACCKMQAAGASLADDYWNSDAIREVRQWLQDQGLIDPTTELATPKGRKWVERVCSVMPR